MKESKLKIYDVWKSPNGNIFIKLTDDYSIAIGAKGNHGPYDWDLIKTQYVKKKDFTEVKQIGRLCFYNPKHARLLAAILGGILLGTLLALIFV